MVPLGKDRGNLYSIFFGCIAGSFFLGTWPSFHSVVPDLKIGSGLGTEQDIVTFYWDHCPQPPAPPFLPLIEDVK